MFPDLIALLILPAVIWASAAYFVRFTSKTAPDSRDGSSAKTKRELPGGSQSRTIYALLTFSLLVASISVLIRHHGMSELAQLFNPIDAGRRILHGILFGLALVGIVLILRYHFPEARNVKFIVLVGIASPPLVRALVLLLVVFAEELWRAVCLTTLIADGFSGPQAVGVIAVAYGLAYLPWGYLVGISDGIIGAVYGGLFLWSGSIFVPIAAHITLRAQHLLYAIIAAPDVPYTKCPVCKTMLGMRQVNLNFKEAFVCPSCNTRITISDQRRGFFRWGFVFISTAIIVAFWDIFPGAGRGSYAQLLVSVAMTVCAGTGLWSIFQAIFPPQLQAGDPDFIALNLNDKSALRPDETEPSDRSENDSK